MEKDNVAKEFNKGSIVGTILRFSFPSALASIISLLCVLTDRYFIGQVAGRHGMAAVTIVYPYVMLINSVNFLFTGVGIIIGIKLGQKRIKSAQLYLGITFFWILIIGGILTLLLWIFNKDLLALFGGTQETFQHAKEYTRYIIPSTIFQIIMGQTIVLRSVGEPLKAMFVNVATAILNIILDYVFVIKFGQGIGGAAFATLLSTMGMSLVFVYYIINGNIIKLRLINIKPNFKVLKEVFKAGAPRFYNQILQSILVVVTNRNATYYGGDIATAAMGVITVVRTTINTAMQGFNQGTGAIISYFYGLKDYKKVTETLKVQLRIVGSFTIFMVGLMIIYAEKITNFFVRNDSEIIFETAKGMRLNLSLMFFTVIFLSCNNFLQSIKQSNLATIYFFIRIVILNIPLVYILGSLLGINGVWLAFPAADTIVSIALYIETRRILKKFDNEG